MQYAPGGTHTQPSIHNNSRSPRKIDSVVCLELQVPSTSRANTLAGTHRGRPTVEHSRTTNAPLRAEEERMPISRAEGSRRSTEGQAQVYAVREGEELPAGYTYVVRAPVLPAFATRNVRNQTETVDLSTPPEGGAPEAIGEVHTAKRAEAARRSLTRTTNKKAHASFAKEMKDSLAEGRPPAVNASEDQTDLKARWHSAAKEIAYGILDLSKEGWKGYSVFDKTKIHTELNTKYKFDPPVDPKRVDKYLAGHLRSSRAVWKAHWQRHGAGDRHQNCPKIAWDKLIKWWPTEACMEESAEMASRRSAVHSASKTGRKALVDRMDDEVRNYAFAPDYDKLVAVQVQM